MWRDRVRFYSFDVTLDRTGVIHILGDGAEDKALQLSGSEMGGRKLVATSASEEFFKPTPEMAARLAKASRIHRSKMIHVRGYDTSLPAHDIKSALTNHFSSCGEIVDFAIFPKEIAEEKALQLNGSDMGGRKLVVQPLKDSPPLEFPIGITFPAWLANPKKKMKKTGRNRKKTCHNKKKTRK